MDWGVGWMRVGVRRRVIECGFLGERSWVY